MLVKKPWKIQFLEDSQSSSKNLKALGPPSYIWGLILDFIKLSKDMMWCEMSPYFLVNLSFVFAVKILNYFLVLILISFMMIFRNYIHIQEFPWD